MYSSWDRERRIGATSFRKSSAIVTTPLLLMSAHSKDPQLRVGFTQYVLMRIS